MICACASLAIGLVISFKAISSWLIPDSFFLLFSSSSFYSSCISSLICFKTDSKGLRIMINWSKQRTWSHYQKLNFVKIIEREAFLVYVQLKKCANNFVTSWICLSITLSYLLFWFFLENFTSLENWSQRKLFELHCLLCQMRLWIEMVMGWV